MLFCCERAWMLHSEGLDGRRRSAPRTKEGKGGVSGRGCLGSVSSSMDPPSSLPYLIQKALRSRVQLLYPCDQLYLDVTDGLEAQKYARIFLIDLSRSPNRQQSHEVGVVGSERLCCHRPPLSSIVIWVFKAWSRRFFVKAISQQVLLAQR